MQPCQFREQQSGAKQGFHFNLPSLANTTGTGAPLAIVVVL